MDVYILLYRVNRGLGAHDTDFQHMIAPKVFRLFLSFRPSYTCCLSVGGGGEGEERKS